MLVGKLNVDRGSQYTSEQFLRLMVRDKGGGGGLARIRCATTYRPSGDENRCWRFFGPQRVLRRAAQSLKRRRF